MSFRRQSTLFHTITKSTIDQSINIDKSTIDQSIHIYLYISMFTALTLNVFNFPLSYPFKVQPS